jgi:hypothetical protein
MLRELRMCTTSLSGRERGTVCKLTPLAKDIAPIHLIARPSFRIGRSAQQADFIARFSSQNPENAERTSELSRVHILLELRDGGIKARDGDGVRPSRNGSAFEGVSLVADRPAPIGTGGVLSLGSHYRMKVIPMPAPKALRIVDAAGLDERDAFVPAGLGAVAFEPLEEQRPPVQALWLLDAAGFRFDSAGGCVWRAIETETAPGLFLRRGGFFLLANISAGDARIVADGRELLPGEVVPLQSGQSLRVGDFTFAVALN